MCTYVYINGKFNPVTEWLSVFFTFLIWYRQKLFYLQLNTDKNFLILSVSMCYVDTNNNLVSFQLVCIANIFLPGPLFGAFLYMSWQQFRPFFCVEDSEERKKVRIVLSPLFFQPSHSHPTQLPQILRHFNQLTPKTLRAFEKRVADGNPLTIFTPRIKNRERWLKKGTNA